MALVKSVELVEIDWVDTDSAAHTVSLTKGQDEAQCVPFVTMSIDGSGGYDDWRQAYYPHVYFDNSGGPRVHADWYSLTATNFDSNGVLYIYVVEFESTVTVQQVSWGASGTSTSDTTTLAAVTTAETFIINSYGFTTDGGPGSSYDDWTDYQWRTILTNTTTVTCDRVGALSLSVSGTIYAVEHSDLNVYHLSGSSTSSSGGGSHTAVTTTRSFVIGSYAGAELSDDIDQGALAFRLNSGTQSIWTRQGSGTNVDWAIQVVELPTGNLVYQVALDTTSLTKTGTIAIGGTVVEDNVAIFTQSQYPGLGNTDDTSGTSTSFVDDVYVGLKTSNTTTVAWSRGNNEGTGTKDTPAKAHTSDVAVIEWDIILTHELAAAATGDGAAAASLMREAKLEAAASGDGTVAADLWIAQKGDFRRRLMMP